MNARRAALQQLDALRGRVRDAKLHDRLRVVRLRSSWAARRKGRDAPHSIVNRSTCDAFVIGMMPGMMGTLIPMARALSTNSKYLRLSKNSWVIRNSAPLSTFRFRFVRSTAGFAALDVLLRVRRTADRKLVRHSSRE